MFKKKEINKIDSYNPNKEIRDFILQAYNAYSKDKIIKDASYRAIGNQTLENFWQTSHDNYNVLVPVKAKSDWKRNAKRTITRDKANTFIAKLTKSLIYPQIIAQNKEQEIDNVVSRIMRVLLEWWERITKAQRVFVDAVQKLVIEGTCHKQIDVVNGKEKRTIVPNEEIFIPNFYQFDIQEQSHLIRCHLTTYEEAEIQFGHLDNWKYVIPGNSKQWGLSDNYFKNDYVNGYLEDDEVQIIYLWQHAGYDENNKPKPKKYNVLINGVLMYETENTLNLKHNQYNIVKGIFEKTADIRFYWGNSLPNKIKGDQSYADAFYTIILNKAIWSLLPTLFNRSGEAFDASILAPGEVIQTQANKDDIFKVNGVADPITPADTNILDMIERNIDRGTQPPEAEGHREKGGQRTLGEVQLRDARASELMEIFGQSIAFLIEDAAEQSVSNIIQFMIKKDVQRLVEGGELLFKKLISIPDQSLANNEIGNLMVNFTPKEQQPNSMDIYAKEQEIKQKTGKNAEIAYIDPSYINEITYLFYVVANPVFKKSDAIERAVAVENYQIIYRNNPHINQREAVKNVIRANHDNEEALMADSPEQPLTSEEGKMPVGKTANSLKKAVKEVPAL